MIMEKLTIEQEELLHRFDELAEKTGSAKQAASLIGISAATISQTDRFDSSAFKKTHQDLFDQYTKTSTSKRFTIS